MTLEDALKHLYSRCSNETKKKVDDLIISGRTSTPERQGEIGKEAVKLLIEDSDLRLTKYNN